MKMRATCSFTGLRGTRAYNETFEVPDEEGQVMLDEGYPVEVIEGPQPQQPAPKGEGAEGEKEGADQGNSGDVPPEACEAPEAAQDGQEQPQQPAPKGEGAEGEKEGADDDRGSASPKPSGSKQPSKGGRAKASKA